VDVAENICIVHVNPDDFTTANTDTNAAGFTQYILDRECYLQTVLGSNSLQVTPLR